MKYNIWRNCDFWEDRCIKRASVWEREITLFMLTLFDSRCLCAHLICQRLQWVQSRVLWQRLWRHKWFKNYIKYVNANGTILPLHFFEEEKNEPDDLKPSNHTHKHVYLTKSIKFSMPAHASLQLLLHGAVGDDVGVEDDVFRATHDSVHIITEINKPNESHAIPFDVLLSTTSKRFYGMRFISQEISWSLFILAILCDLIFSLQNGISTIMWNLLITLDENCWWDVVC